MGILPKPLGAHVCITHLTYLFARPTISFEPTFAALEKKANILCAGILAAILILGKMFGASLKGLIPLAVCVSSGVYLWAKEVIRSGREAEWDSEKTRGETVRPPTQLPCHLLCDVLLMLHTGNCKPAARICRVDEHVDGYRLGPCQPRHVPERRRYSRRCHAGFGAWDYR